MLKLQAAQRAPGATHRKPFSLSTPNARRIEFVSDVFATLLAIVCHGVIQSLCCSARETSWAREKIITSSVAAANVMASFIGVALSAATIESVPNPA